MKKLLLFLAVILLMNHGSMSAIAQEANSEEEALDRAIEGFGYTSGIAFQCLPPEEAAELEQDAIKAFTGIIRLFGSDRAFFYAAAYGSGATAEVDRSQCEQRVREFREAIENGSLTEGE